MIIILTLASSLVTAEGRTSPDYTGELFVPGGIVAAGVLGWVGTIIAKRLREPTRIETLWSRLDAQDERIAEQDTKIGTLERRADAAERRDESKGRIIRDLARQWKGPTPRLNPSDLDELDEQTLELDHPWRVKP